MLQQHYKFAITFIVLVVYIMALMGEGLADDFTLRLVVNPSKTDVPLGSEPIALTARVKGKNLTYEWKLLGPGKLEGKGSSVFYVLPEKIEGDSEQALITVTVKDETGEETTESVTFNIIAQEKSTTGKGMSTTTKIALGVGAAAALGGGIALAAGGDDDDDDDGDATDGSIVGFWYYWGYWSGVYTYGDLIFDGNASSGTYVRRDEDESLIYYGTYTVDGIKIKLIDNSDSTGEPAQLDGAFVSATEITGTWYRISNSGINGSWGAGKREEE